MLQFNPIHLPDLSTIEAVGASVAFPNNKFIDFISVYVPNGNNCDEEDIRRIIQPRNNSIVMCGDFNAHHARWESTCTQSNQSGRVIARILEEEENIELATPTDLGTRQNPTTLDYSTIDLALMAPHLALTTEMTRGPDIGSDHLPIHIRINAQPITSPDHPPSWNFKKANWTTWNNDVNRLINSKSFYDTDDPRNKYEILHDSLLEANQMGNITYNKSNNKTRPEPAQPWWNEDCRRAVALARKARNACDPYRGGVNCASNLSAWKEKENFKKRTIIKAKKTSPINHINSLNPKSDPATTWTFVKSWTQGVKPPDLTSSPIKDPETGLLVTLAKEKAKIFANQYDHQKEDIPDDPEFEEVIIQKINSMEPNGLNNKIVRSELNFGLNNLKSNAMGKDQIHNKMIKNLSETNKTHLLHLFNSMLMSSYVPADWKQGTIIPLRKPGKPPEKPDSYRPVCLTSCLGKVMERIVNQRLTWHFEKNGLRLKTQAGFRKGRSTMDNIIGLEHFIREGFNKRNPLNTYAVFLDVTKAFDKTWIQGILYKLASKGVNGPILGWLDNLLRDRTYCVRVGNTYSEDHPLKVGVPQGSPLSPFLFSVIMDDFPTMHSPGEL